MSDLVEKIKNGITASNGNSEYFIGLRNGMRWCLSLIEDKEPIYESSAQPEPDTALYVDGFNDGYKQGENDAQPNVARDIATIIENEKDMRVMLQPEIIRCKDCKYRGETPIADGRYWCDIHDDFMYYCSDAEKKTDG